MVVMEVVVEGGDVDDDDGYEDDNSDHMNNLKLLNYKIRQGQKTSALLGFALQRGWKERRVILRNANRPFPHCKKKKKSKTTAQIHSLRVFLFQSLKNFGHVNPPLSSPPKNRTITTPILSRQISPAGPPTATCHLHRLLLRAQTLGLKCNKCDY